METFVKAESYALEVLLAGVETRFREEHAVLVEAINEQRAMTKEQTALLEALCSEVKTTSEKVDSFAHTGRLRNIEWDVAAIAKSVQGVAKGTDAVSSFVAGLNERIDDIRLVLEHKANENRKAEEEKRLAELKAEEEKRKAKWRSDCSFGRNFKSDDGTLCQRPQGVDGEGECDDRLRQHR